MSIVSSSNWSIIVNPSLFLSFVLVLFIVIGLTVESVTVKELLWTLSICFSLSFKCKFNTSVMVL